MKTPAWIELPLFAAVLLVVTILVMWAQQPGTACALRPEANRRLVLSRQVDREHLEADLATVDRVARRYAGASSANAAGQQARFLECETTLIQRLAATHGLSPEQIHRAPADVQ
jgi:hypothetical protein